MWETPAWGAATRRANQKEFPQNLTQILPPNLTPPPHPRTEYGATDDAVSSIQRIFIDI